MPAVKIKDPDATEDFGFNWALFLGDDTIASSNWTADPDDSGNTDALVIEEDTHTDTMTTVWLSGGTGVYRLTNHIVTTNTPAREDDRTFVLRIRER